MFPDVNPELVKLLSQMLEFNPYFRLTAKKALKSKLFDKIRLKEYEQPSPEKVKLEIYGDSGFNYKDGKSIKYKTYNDFKKILAKECAKIKKISPLYSWLLQVLKY